MNSALTQNPIVTSMAGRRLQTSKVNCRIRRLTVPVSDLSYSGRCA